MKLHFFTPEADLQTRVQYENALGKGLLMQCATDGEIKDVLQCFANIMRHKILKPIMKAAKSAKHFAEIQPDEFRIAIGELASAHSAQGRQFGAVLKNRYKTGEDITDNIHHVRHLLNTVNKTLININKNANTADKIAIVIKIIVDLSYGYVEKLPSLRIDREEPFDRIKDMLWPSPEELQVRIARKEVDQQPKFTTELGIGREDVLSLEEMPHKEHYYAGKAVFIGVDMEERLRLTAQKFDELYAHSKENPELLETFIHQQKMNFGSLWIKLFMAKKDHPGGTFQAFSEMDKEEFAKIVQTFEPSSIKLAKRLQAPLVASISGSTARPFITLQHLGAFYSKKKFDYKKAKILIKSIQALFNQAGHHSAFEVNEIYNRLIDYIVLDHPEKLPYTLRQKMKKIQRNPNTQNKHFMIESILNYSHPGHYSLLLYKAPPRKLVEKKEEKVENGFYI